MTRLSSDTHGRSIRGPVRNLLWAPSERFAIQNIGLVSQSTSPIVIISAPRYPGDSLPTRRNKMRQMGVAVAMNHGNWVFSDLPLPLIEQMETYPLVHSS